MQFLEHLDATLLVLPKLRHQRVLAHAHQLTDLLVRPPLACKVESFHLELHAWRRGMKPFVMQLFEWV